jgi:hypothetical protein
MDLEGEHADIRRTVAGIDALKGLPKLLARGTLKLPAKPAQCAVAA